MMYDESECDKVNRTCFCPLSYIITLGSSPHISSSLSRSGQSRRFLGQEKISLIILLVFSLFFF